jgi:hypothetical protein
MEELAGGQRDLFEWHRNSANAQWSWRRRASSNQIKYYMSEEMVATGACMGPIYMCNKIHGVVLYIYEKKNIYLCVSPFFFFKKNVSPF